MVSRDVLIDVIEYWEEEINKAQVIYRDIEEKIERTLDMEEITVITGVRRAGKTYILFDLFKKYGGTYLNFEDERLMGFEIGDFEKILDIMAQKNSKILYLDEVQEVNGWEKFAHRVHRKIKIFVTGSNSKLLSSDYAKVLVGRTKTFTVYPLSYAEFLRFTNMKVGRESLLKYMEIGGFPRIVLSGDISLAREYLERIVYRDIIPRSGINYPEALKNLSIYLLSNVGKEFSYRSLTQITGIKHEITLRKYVDLLKNAFLIDILPRYSPSLKIQESYGKKVYAVDTSFITLGKRNSGDFGRILENMVFLHLKRKNESLYYLKDLYEADFVLCHSLKPWKIINVMFEARNEETLKREITSLRYFGKKYGVPLELISMYPVEVPKGIESRIAHRYLVEL